MAAYGVENHLTCFSGHAFNGDRTLMLNIDCKDYWHSHCSTCQPSLYYWHMSHFHQHYQFSYYSLLPCAISWDHVEIFVNTCYFSASVASINILESYNGCISVTTLAITVYCCIQSREVRMSLLLLSKMLKKGVHFII